MSLLDKLAFLTLHLATALQRVSKLWSVDCDRPLLTFSLFQQQCTLSWLCMEHAASFQVTKWLDVLPDIEVANGADGRWTHLAQLIPGLQSQLQEAPSVAVEEPSAMLPPATSGVGSIQ